jgi:hypothetical protein
MVKSLNSSLGVPPSSRVDAQGRLLNLMYDPKNYGPSKHCFMNVFLETELAIAEKEFIDEFGENVFMELLGDRTIGIGQ